MESPDAKGSALMAPSLLTFPKKGGHKGRMGCHWIRVGKHGPGSAPALADLVIWDRSLILPESQFLLFYKIWEVLPVSIRELLR